MYCPKGKESMSSGPQIEVVGGMYNVGPISKAGYTSNIGGIMPVGNTKGIMTAGNIGGIAPSGNIDSFPRA